MCRPSRAPRTAHAGPPAATRDTRAPRTADCSGSPPRAARARSQDRSPSVSVLGLAVARHLLSPGRAARSVTHATIVRPMPETYTDHPLLCSRFDDALLLAAHHHRRQLRKGTEIPYISHLLA